MGDAPPAVVGRERELGLVAACLDRAARGDSTVLVIDGASGAGKTTLLRTAAEGARAAGFLVLSAQASTVERDFAFGVVRQLLEPGVLVVPEPERRELLSGMAEPADRVLGISGGAVHEAPGPDVYATLHGLYHLAIKLAARQPLLLAVDDVEQTDACSLRWLAYLARRLGSLPVAIAMTVGAGSGWTDPTLLAGLTVDATRLTVEGLDHGGCEALIEHEFGEPAALEFTAACRAATGGNPFLVKELAKALAAGGTRPTAGSARALHDLGPAQLTQTVLTRLRARDPALAAVARAVAALGEPDLAVAAAAAELDLTEAGEAAQTLVARGVFRPGPSLAFEHSIVRAAVAADLSTVDYEVACARAARYLHDTGATAGQIAPYLVRTGVARGPWVIGVLERACREAMLGGAPDVAAACLRRVLRESLPESARSAVLFQLGIAELSLDPQSALDNLTEAHARAPDPLARADIAVMLAQELAERERYTEATELLDATANEVRPVNRDVAVRLELCSVCVSLDAHHVVSALADRLAVIKQYDDLPPETVRFRHALLTFLAAVDGPSWGAASDAVTAAWTQRVPPRSWQGTPWDVTSGWQYVYLAISLIVTEKLELADQYCSEMLAETTALGLSLGSAASEALRAQARFRAGALADAEDDARSALAVLDEIRTGTRTATIFALSTLVETLVDRGQPEAAAAELERRALTGELPPSWRYNYLLVSRGRLWLALGDPRRALADVVECGRRYAQRGMTGRSPLAWRMLAALAHHALGEADAAREMAAVELAHAREWGGPVRLGVALRISGMVATEPEKLSLLMESVCTLSTSTFRLERAWSLAELGAELVRVGRIDEAEPHLRAAMEIATACGCDALMNAVRDARGGVRMNRCQSGGLTPHERRIADLAVRGMTNREIAEAFLVTQRAVEQHLTRVYRKLGINRRSQLGIALQETDRAQ
ncbi:BREX system ATP-binding domain-containing protein [Allokutzneria albata]|uniref:Regulatory protein, luxR family n=1 Tax=Allokutzneria albata TaxID=211114 RepID=A0A1H0ATA8_ALLAB|nr:LuxR family transcriptional regulator [Allokutzneria albata]SDN36569.1 regulatory protein, luxR family [Allokutzneria albata]